MKLLWTSRSWDQYVFWQRSDPEYVRKINSLIADIMREPFQGLGKPEPLRRDLQGFWSRRISEEHRLVYRVSGSQVDRCIEIIQCRYHY